MRLRRGTALFCVLLALLTAGLLTLVVRLSLEGGRAMKESDASFDQGKLLESIVYARRAASLYVPGAPHVYRADARLDAIATGAESAKMREVATQAWQAIRSTELVRTERFGRSQSRLSLANRRLASLLVAGSDETVLADEERHARLILGQLNTNETVTNGSLMGQWLGLGVLATGLLLMAGSLERSASLLSRRTLLSGLVVAVGAFGWAVCLLLG